MRPPSKRAASNDSRVEEPPSCLVRLPAALDHSDSLSCSVVAEIARWRTHDARVRTRRSPADTSH